MYYETSDIQKILNEIKQKYNVPLIYYIKKDMPTEKEVNHFREEVITSTAVLQIIDEIQTQLKGIEKVNHSDFSLDVPTQCSDCFAKRSNGICLVCAFTGDLSESGFYQKYGIMEHCPFLTRKQIYDLAYDFMINRFELLHQELIDEYDEEIKENIKKRFDSMWSDNID